MSTAKHTPGPWRWELNEQHRSLCLVGGRPRYDLTIIQPTRWGMNRATVMIRDTAHDGMNLMHKLHERRDWIAPFEGRAHHASWCADVVHPDMRLIAAAPDLLEALKLAEDVLSRRPYSAEIWPNGTHPQTGITQIREAIAKATGEPA